MSELREPVIPQSRELTDEALDIIFAGANFKDLRDGVFTQSDRTFLTEDSMKNLIKKMHDFFQALNPVLAPGVKVEDVAKAIHEKFNGKITGNEGMLKYFSMQGPLDEAAAKKIVEEFRLASSE